MTRSTAGGEHDVERRSPAITAFLMTQKGYAFLRAAVPGYRDLFAKIVIGVDDAISDDRYREIVSLCEEQHIPWITRHAFQNVESEYAVAVSWRWLIRHDPNKLVVFHDSLLPRYRGFNPLVSCLLNGERTIGVSAILGAEAFDTGDILFQSSTEIAYPITIADAIGKITANYAEAALHVLELIALGRPLVGVAQNELEASYSLWRDEQDYQVDWNWSADYICRFVDALGAPYRGAACFVDGIKARIVRASPSAAVKLENPCPGKVLFNRDGTPVVVTGRGLVNILALVDDTSGQSLLPLPRFRVRFS